MSIKPKIINFIIGTITLLIGGLIYLIFRQDILALQYIKDCEWLKSIRVEIHSNSFFINWIIYSLPDALWYYSLLSFMFIFYEKTILSRFLILIAIILPYIWEFSQFFHLLLGTYDNIDIIFYLITLIIFLCFQKKLNH